MTYTKSTPVGGVRAELVAAPVDADATSGCEPGDFAAGAFTGKIALIKRGGCAFAVKQQNAAAAGAVAAVIYNNAEGVLSGTLGDAASGKIPTGGITLAEGTALAAELAKGPVTLSWRSASSSRRVPPTTSSRRPRPATPPTPWCSARTSTPSPRAPASTTTARAPPASSRPP